jgi:hypothetical protein
MASTLRRGGSCGDDVVESRASLAAAQRLEVLVSGRGCGEVLFEGEPPVGEKVRDVGGVEAEGPRLASTRDAFDPSPGLGKGVEVTVYDGPVDVGEDEDLWAAPGSGAAPRRGGDARRRRRRTVRIRG